jgi:hypothetical protein
VIKDGELADNKWDFVAGKLFDEFVAVGVLAVQYGEIPPLAAGGVQALEFADDPAGFVLFGFQLDDADFFAFFFIGA